LVIRKFEKVVTELAVVTIVDDVAVELVAGADAEVVVEISVKSVNGVVFELEVRTAFESIIETIDGI